MHPKEAAELATDQFPVLRLETDEDPTAVGLLNQPESTFFIYLLVAVVAGFLAVMEALLITLAKTPELDSGRFLGQSYLNAVLGLAYVSLILNFGSIMSALKVIHLLGKMNYPDTEKGTGPPTNWTNLEPTFMTKPHGVNGLTCFLMYHCFYCLFMGGLCILAQLIMLHLAT